MPFHFQGVGPLRHTNKIFFLINMSYCIDVTKTSLLALSKCSRLNTFESRGCPLITSLGLAAIAVGVSRSKKLGIKKCHNNCDTAMLQLAHFSQNLRQVFSLFCQNNTSRTSTDIGGYGLFLSLQITSSDSSVTDVG